MDPDAIFPALFGLFAVAFPAQRQLPEKALF